MITPNAQQCRMQQVVDYPEQLLTPLIHHFPSLPQSPWFPLSAHWSAEAWWSSCPARRTRGPQPDVDSDRQRRRGRSSQTRPDGGPLCPPHQQGKTVAKVELACHSLHGIPCVKCFLFQSSKWLVVWSLQSRFFLDCFTLQEYHGCTSVFGLIKYLAVCFKVPKFSSCCITCTDHV